MTNQPIDEGKIERQLNKLTQRQCQILYWVCHGLTYEEIGLKIGYTDKLVQKEMSEVYRLMELTGHGRAQKRYMLTSVICPIHEKLVSDPQTDCSDRVIDVIDREPDPQALTEVKEDAQKGLIPLRALVHIPQTEPSEPPEGRGRQAMMARVPPPYTHQNPIPWILVGVLGTLLLVAVVAIVVLLTQQPGTPIPKPVTPGIAVVNATQQPQVIPATLVPPSPLPTYTLPPTYTPFPTFTPLPTQRGPTEVKDPPTATQSVPQGTIITAGKSIESSGIAIYTSSTVEVWSSTIFRLQVLVRNKRSQSYLLRYMCDGIHLRDDTGKQYALDTSSHDVRRVFQYTLSPDRETEMGCGFSYLYFNGPVLVKAKYLVLTIDELAGMTNLNWRFDLQ